MAASNERAADTTSRRLRLGAVIAVAIAIAVIVFLILNGGDSSDDSKSPGPTAATAATLRALPPAVGHPVYWAGPRSEETASYELSRTANGNIYIRYLPAGVQLGAPRPDYLTVGTYPFRNPVRALRRQARRPDAVDERVAGGGIVVANSANAQNAYLAFPGEDVQVEVFHPTPGRAFDLVTSGRVVPVS